MDLCGSSHEPICFVRDQYILHYEYRLTIGSQVNWILSLKMLNAVNCIKIDTSIKKFLIIVKP